MCQHPLWREDFMKLAYMAEPFISQLYFRVLMNILRCGKFTWTSRNSCISQTRRLNICHFRWWWFKVDGYIQWVFFNRGRFNVPPIPRLGEHVRYLLAAKWKRVFQYYGEGWSQTEFYFGVNKSIFQACVDFASCQRIQGTATFSNLFLPSFY